MLTEGCSWGVAGLLGEVPDESLAGGLSDALAHAVEHLARRDPVEGGSGAKGRKHPSRHGKHGLVEGGQQGAEDDHASWGDDICNCAAQAFTGITQELSDCLKIANLHSTRRSVLLSMQRALCDNANLTSM